MIPGPKAHSITVIPLLTPSPVNMPTKHPGRRETITCEGMATSNSNKLPRKSADSNFRATKNDATTRTVSRNAAMMTGGNALRFLMGWHRLIVPEQKTNTA